MPLRAPFCAALLLAAAPALALAAPAPASPEGAAHLAAAPLQSARPAAPLRLARATDDFASPYASPARTPGPNLGHTAVERRLAGDGVTGSVGYLCGIDLNDPDTWRRGAGPDSSAGHKGTFLGAKLGVSFR